MPTPGSSTPGNVEFTIDTAWARGWEKITLLLNFGDGTPFGSTGEFDADSSASAIGAFTDAAGVYYILHRPRFNTPMLLLLRLTLLLLLRLPLNSIKIAAAVEHRTTLSIMQ